MVKPSQFTPLALEAMAAGIPEDELFTPMLDGKRVVMRVPHAQMLWGRGPGYRGRVTDRLTGKQYKIQGRACGLAGCWCDADATEVSGGRPW